MANSITADARAVAAEPAANAAVAPPRLSAAVKDSIGSEFARYAARFIGADEWRTQSAIDLLVSAVLRRLARRSARPDGAGRVFASLDGPHIDSDLLAAVDRLLADEPEEEGEGVDAGRVSGQGLLGRRTESHVLNIASTSGLTADATWHLLAFTAPLVYAALRDHVRDRGLDAEALRDRLANEYVKARSRRRHRLRRTVTAAADRALLLTREMHARGAAAIARHDHRTLVRGGIAAAGAVAAVSLLLGGGSPRTEAVSAGSGRATRLVADANALVPGARYSAGVDGLVAFLSGGESEVEYVFVLDGVQFDPESATLRPASNAQLEQLAQVLADFPEARLTIEAYADGAPEGAQGYARSESRALAVRAAITALGIQPSRMRHAGNGGAGQGGSRVEARVTKG